MSIQYSILKHEKLTDMVDHVNKVIEEGWEPIGGVSHAAGTYFQAIRKVIHSWGPPLELKGPDALSQ